MPFDKADATLVPEAGSCADCPKRTGFNTLLFGDMGNRHDCCSDAGCFNHKLGKFVEQQIAAKPKLVQITTAHGTGSSGILPRNRYIALQLTNPAKSKQPLSPYQKPCKHMAEAIVVDGVERGRTTKVCGEPTCAVHFPDRRTPDPAQLAKEREQRRKELEKRKLETTIHHRTLAEVLRKVSAPLDRADLVLIANAMLDKTEALRRETLARRHKMVDGSTSEVTYPQVQKGLAQLLRQSDESGLSKLIVEIALLGGVESVSQEGTDVLTTTARRHRVDVAKVRATVVAEFAAKQAKMGAKSVTKCTSKASKAA